ncbi:hypothetical protein IEQ34_020125 [Dendrobium chrysotoxum]|uniref:Uncharacterized protein n=1 Tax=Dendrobium chrysotoxum TaxID=161865 RepID=A0AAV7G167_DENCH|nr:hypothetical protein IEQ34_020125 [Dendrobium chrysotoxum]
MEGGGRAKRMESLGWLTESAVMPKKHKAIEGVGASSIVELKAQLYRTQEETRKTRESAPDSSEYLRAKKKILPSGPLSHKNPGVEERDKRDKLELKAIKDGSVSYAALERKAELYEKLVRGELPDEENQEKYCVDFFKKSITEVEPEQPEERSPAAGYPQEKQDGKDDDAVLSTRPFGPGRTNTTVDSDEHKRFVREVHEEASQAREKSTLVKLRRQEQEAARREKLRQAYLRKQLEKLTSSNQKSA